MQRWVFGKLGCTVTAFIMYFVGCTSIYLLTALTYERFMFLRDHMICVRSSNNRNSYLKILICIFLGLFWSMLPLFGWSHYSLEGLKTSCSIEWNEKVANVLSYNITILIAVFLIPLALMIYFNFKLISMVSLIFFK